MNITQIFALLLMLFSFTTATLGYLMIKGKNVLKYHKFCAIITLILIALNLILSY